jgi:hypothetical protein
VSIDDWVTYLVMGVYVGAHDCGYYTDEAVAYYACVVAAHGACGAAHHGVAGGVEVGTGSGNAQSTVVHMLGTLAVEGCLVPGNKGRKYH